MTCPSPVAPSGDGWEWEQALWNAGKYRVAGVDEVGRGALAGPVVAAAVIVPVGARFSPLVRDSKRLSPRRREEALREIEALAVAIGVGIVDAATVDRINVRQAARLAMKRAVEALEPRPDHLLVDAERVDTALPQHSLIGGDNISRAIAAASIVAKVTRDRQARLWHEQYPDYGFLDHKGYATRRHLESLAALGPCPLHRLTFLRRRFFASGVQQELPGFERSFGAI